MPSSLPVSTRLVASKHQVSTLLSGEAVILGMNDGVYYGLDAVGARVWELFQEPRTLGEVADIVAAEYAVERPRVLADLQVLAGDLVQRQLLDVVPSPAP